jgi:hypothetical protein
MEYNDTVNDEKISAIKAQRGIENMEELYRQLQEAEDDGEEGEGEGEGEGARSMTKQKAKNLFIKPMFLK